MANDRSTSEETAVVATYSSRHEAEMAKSFLSDQGITAFVAADDVHPPLQVTEGSRVRVLSGNLASAREALNGAGMLPDSDMDARRSELPAGGTHETPRWRIWLYVALAALFILALLMQGVI